MKQSQIKAGLDSNSLLELSLLRYYSLKAAIQAMQHSNAVRITTMNECSVYGTDVVNGITPMRCIEPVIGRANYNSND